MESHNELVGAVPNHRIQKLEEVGFVWSIIEVSGPNRETRVSVEKSHENFDFASLMFHSPMC
jgi:hypothetical protein